jgi:hypothetical protein
MEKIKIKLLKSTDPPLIFNEHGCVDSGLVCSDVWLVDDIVIIVDNWQQET